MSITIVGGGNPSGPTFPVQRSVRLRSSASAFFNRTPASTTNRTTWTYSAWIKRGSVASGDYVNFLTTQYTTASPNSSIIRISGSGLEFISYDTGAVSVQVLTTQVFRDPSAWYHIVVVVDTTQATASNRVKLYVNGVQVTALTTATYPSLNYNTYINVASLANIIGGLWINSGGGYAIAQNYDGYLTEVNFIDGQALTPASFGAYNSYGVWSPSKYSGTYGTNGFYLNFQDNSAATAAAIGKDSSGNGNNWTPNNISVTAGVTYDSMLDVPTLTNANNANFAVISAVDKNGTLATNQNGNLELVGAGGWGQARCTMQLATGKWYWEAVLLASSTGAQIGIAALNTTMPTALAGTNAVAINAAGYWYIENATGTSGHTGFAINDIIRFTYDSSTGVFQYAINGGSFTTITTLSTSDGRIWTPAISVYATTDKFAINFGQRPFTYTPPTGYNRLCTYNLPTPTISNGAGYMAATLYTGNGVASPNALVVTNTVNSVSFQPDLVWVKSRSLAQGHVWQDAVRGTSVFLQSNSTLGDQATGGGDISSFNSNGFTLSYANARTNQNAATYVGWQWKANGTPATINTTGTLTSTISANTTAGFSIVTFTAQTSGTATVGHGLGIAPSLVITKPRVTAIGWTTYHQSLGNTAYVQLNTTAASTASITAWNNTSPTSSVITLGSGFSNIGTYVAYCFSEIAGYSKFGSYTGNSSTDGPFVYTGFRPRWIMVKNTTLSGSGQSDWHMVDTSRNPYNLSNLGIWADSTIAEYTAPNESFDILSNGFKLRGSSNVTNISGSTFIYMAFAENPFNYSLAR